MCHQDLVWPMKREKGIGGLLVAPSHHDKFFLGQLGRHGHPTLTAIAYKQEGMAWQRGYKEFPKAAGQ